jgi:hypothetical protein
MSDAPSIYAIHPRLAFNCPSCGNARQAFDPSSVYLGCPDCGRLLDVTQEAPVVVTQSHDPAAVPPANEPLYLHALVVLGERLWRVVGRRFTFMHYQTPQAPDEPPTDAEITEWDLLCRRGQRAILIETTAGYEFLQPVPAKHSGLPSGQQMIDFETGEPVDIDRRGILEMGFQEGETRYAFTHRGDAMEFATYRVEDGMGWLRYRQGNRPASFELMETWHCTPMGLNDLNAALRRAETEDYPSVENEPNPMAEKPRKGFFARLFGRGKPD